MPGDHSRTLGRRRLVRRLQGDAMGRGQGLEHLAGIKLGLAHRQPARALAAKATFAHAPDLGAALDGMAEHRRAGGAGQRHAHPRDLQVEPVGLGRDAQLAGVATRVPFQPHPVEVEVQPGERRVIGRVHRLTGIDRREPWPGPAVDIEIPGDMAKAAFG